MLTVAALLPLVTQILEVVKLSMEFEKDRLESMTAEQKKVYWDRRQRIEDMAWVLIDLLAQAFEREKKAA